MKQPIKFFQIAANENFVMGLDGMGRVWRKQISHSFDPSWKLIESPTMELSSKEEDSDKEES